MLSVNCTGVWYPRRLEEDIASPGTGVTGSYERPCGFWESKFSCSQEEHLMLLATEPPFSPMYDNFIVIVSNITISSEKVTWSKNFQCVSFKVP